jgi:hypothetical protein
MPTAEAVQAYVLAKQRVQEESQPAAHQRIVDILAIILAVVSIVFAGIQFMDSREIRGKTESILASTTTRYVAEFPNNIPKITELIEGTCGNLDIMADVPGYGAYSNAKAYLDYKEAILRVAARRVGEDGNTQNCVGKQLGHDIERNRRHPRVRLLLFAPSDRTICL